MKEWLTTGQMIDRLKVGEVAKNQSYEGCIKRTEAGLIECNDEHEPVKPLKIDNEILESMWIILPKYVSFEEAMKALKEGKKVYFHRNGEVIHFHNKPKFRSVATLENSDLTLQDLIEGKWTIEE
jgi:hypothetical protein